MVGIIATEKLISVLFIGNCKLVAKLLQCFGRRPVIHPGVCKPSNAEVHNVKHAFFQSHTKQCRLLTVQCTVNLFILLLTLSLLWCQPTVLPMPMVLFSTRSALDRQSAWPYSTVSVCTGPGPGPGPLRSNIASVRSQNIFWTGLGPCVAFALLFLFISYKPHFTSATKKKVIDVTASIGWICYVGKQ